MTPRERLTAAARGGPTDRRAVLLWPRETHGPYGAHGSYGARSDAYVVPVSEVGTQLAETPDHAVLASVCAPLGRAMADNFDLSTLLREDPEAGEAKLQGYIDETRMEMKTALEFGADGVFYRLMGAHPVASTPMQYGGFYLEPDRELLGEIEDARLNVLFVEGGPEPYLDFVADLPAHLFAWDAEVEVNLVRSMRRGALAASDPAAEVLFAADWDTIAPWAENGAGLEPTHV